MIRLKYKTILLLLIIILQVNIFQGEAVDSLDTSAVQYRIDREWVTVWINEDASIDVHYNITITYESSAQGYLTIGLPAKDYEIISVKDLSGNSLDYEDISSGNYYAIEIYFGHSMMPGDSGTALLSATVQNMLFPNETNTGYVDMQFIPTYFNAETVDLRVAIVPPKGVTKDVIKTSETAFFTTINGDFAVYWERDNLPPNTQLIYGVSLPEHYVTLPRKGPDIWLYLAIASGVIAIIAVIIFLRKKQKEAYQKPKIRIEALGPARGFTAVEAAVVVGLEPVRALTMVLFGLLLKGFIVITETEPLIKVEKLPKPQDETTPHPRYYEIDFFKAIEPDGSLNEVNLAKTYLVLRYNVDKKMRGYARVDTVNYYRSIVNDAWNQVKKANTPQLAREAIENNLEWLLLDKEYEKRFKNEFPPNIVIIPSPRWYWYGPHFPRRTPTPTTTEVKPTTAQEFANRIVTGIEQAAQGLVKNVEDFTRRLIPPKITAQSSEPVRRPSSCICACASCACACACVSCACACAGGGAR